MLEYKGKQVLISDILHDAADIFLRNTRNDTAPRICARWNNENDSIKLEEVEREAERFSCCAVDAAVAYNFGLERWSPEVDKLGKQIKKGLRAMGCPTGSSNAFTKYGDNWDYDRTDIQGMRYFWLKWAALMAQEQGV